MFRGPQATQGSDLQPVGNHDEASATSIHRKAGAFTYHNLTLSCFLFGLIWPFTRRSTEYSDIYGPERVCGREAHYSKQPNAGEAESPARYSKNTGKSKTTRPGVDKGRRSRVKLTITLCQSSGITARDLACSQCFYPGRQPLAQCKLFTTIAIPILL